MNKVTDPSLLESLNTPISDPALLEQLNAPQAQPQQPQAQPTREELLAKYGQEAYDSMSNTGKFGVGVAKGALNTWYGLKELMGNELTQDEQDELTRLAGTTGGWATAGELTGDLATLAIPGGAAVKGAKMLGKGNRLLKATATALPLATDIAASAALGYTKAPTDGKTRSSRAIEDGIWAGVGGGIGAGVNKLFKGAKVTPEAQQIIDKGGFVTPGRATDAGLPQLLENFAGFTPLLAKSVGKSRQKSTNSWSEIIMNEVAPKGTKITENGQAGMRQLKQGYDDAYSDAWKGATNISNEGRIGVVNAATNAADDLGVEGLGVLKKVMGDFKELTANPSSKGLKEFDNLLRKQAQKGGRDGGEIREVLKTMKSEMRKGLSGDTSKKLSEVDGQYKNYMVARKAASKAAENEGVFTPKQLLSAARQVGGETRTAMGTSPMQGLATGGNKMFSKDMNTAFLDPVRRFAKYAPSPPGLEKMSQSLIGNTSTQRGLSALADELRRLGVSGATLGGAIQGED